MSNLAEIVLPPGTKRITVSDVSTLFAHAIHPDLPDDAPRFLTALAKQVVSDDGGTEEDAEPLSGADRLAEEQLLAWMDRDAGVEVSYDTDWALLEAIWAGLPPLTLPLRETEWQRYATAFQNSTLRPDWRLIATWKSPSLLNDYARIVTAVEHDKALDMAMAAGVIVPRSSLSLLPTPGIIGNQLDHAFFTVEELKRYAATHCIGVSVAPMPAVEDVRDGGTEKAGSGAIDWNFWSAMPKARHWQACALSLSIDPDSLKQSPQSWMAGPGGGPVFEPSSFQDGASGERFAKRLRLLEANRYDSTFFTLPMAKFSNLGADEVKLDEFAAWALSVGWTDAPDELTSLARKQAPSLPTPVLDLPDRDPEYQVKYERAWSLYDELDKWEGMKHQDDPIRAKMIDTELARIRAELAQIDSPAPSLAAPSSQTPHHVDVTPAEPTRKPSKSITQTGGEMPHLLLSRAAESCAHKTGYPVTSDMLLQLAGMEKLNIFFIARTVILLEKNGHADTSIIHSIGDYIHLPADLANWMHGSIENPRTVEASSLPSPSGPRFIKDHYSGKPRTIEIREADLFVSFEDAKSLAISMSTHTNKAVQTHVVLPIAEELQQKGNAIALAMPEPPVAQVVGSVPAPSMHRIRNREASIMTAEIARARLNAPDQTLVASVWGELLKLAEQQFGVMVGVVPEGIQYRGRRPRDDGAFDVFTLRSLRERMTREAASERA